jgi:hypothetical protein
VFFRTQIYVPEVENDLNTTGSCGGAEKEQIREVLRDLRPILEAQGIQFPDIDGVMSDEEHRSSLASIARGGRLLGEL